MEDEKKSTIRPVIVRYQETVPPSNDVPAGYREGATFEVVSPEAAWTVHPNATILRYADGDEYKQRAAKKEVRERDNPPQEEPAETSTPEPVVEVVDIEGGEVVEVVEVTQEPKKSDEGRSGRKDK